MKKTLERIIEWLHSLTRKEVSGQEMANKRREGTATHEDLCQ